jgi:3-dehydroquinate dehydratase type I
MRDKYCLPIIRDSQQGVKDAIAEAGDYSHYEVWLDYVADADADFVTQLASAHPDKLVLVFRRLELEPMKMTAAKRLAIFHALDGKPVMIDIDASHQKQDFSAISREKLDLHIIGSYHNYDETPSDDALDDIVAGLAENNVDIIKVATYCSSEEDALRLLALQQTLKRQGSKHIVIGMGTMGLVTRVFGSVWGNELVFASNDEDALTTPGELTRDHLEGVWRLLGL